MRPRVKNKDGPGWRESRGESALQDKIQCSLRKDRVHRAGGGLFSPFRVHLLIVFCDLQEQGSSAVQKRNFRKVFSSNGSVCVVQETPPVWLPTPVSAAISGLGLRNISSKAISSAII
ncbi:uncharacterized protein J5F26_012907 [Ciconia maguari]